MTEQPVSIPCQLEADAFPAELDVVLRMHPSGTSPQPQQFDFYQVLYMLRGSCQLTVDGKNSSLRRGELMFLPPMVTAVLPDLAPMDQLLMLSVRRSTFASCHTALLREQDPLMDFFRKSLYGAGGSVLLYPIRTDQELEQLLLRMLREQSGDTRYLAPLLDALLSELLALLLRRHSQEVQSLTLETRELRQTILPILNYIQDHMETVTLGDVARQFHYAEPYLSRMLKEYTGQGFSVYVRQLRMARAQTLLENSGLSVGDVAEMVGYSSASYFYSAFREEYGITPAQYRRNHQEKRYQNLEELHGLRTP